MRLRTRENEIHRSTATDPPRAARIAIQ